MGSRIVRCVITALTVVMLGTVAAPREAGAAGQHGRARAFSRTLTLGKSFSVTSNGCGLSVTNESAVRLNVSCFSRDRVRVGRGRIALRYNQYGTLRSRGCALSVTARRPSRVQVSCVAVAPARTFVGSVSCDTPGKTPQSRVVRTSVLFDQPIAPSSGAASRNREASTATQVNGFAGALDTRRRSRVKVALESASNSSEPRVRFEVSPESGPGSYKEKGSWSVGINAKGKVSLRGTSTAVLNEPADAWRAKCNWELQSSQESSVGPVPVDMIRRVVAPPKAGLLQTRASSTGCGSLYGATTSGLTVAAAVLSFSTPVSAVLSIAAVGTSIAGSNQGNSCLSSQLNNINQQLSTQAYQIQQIQTYLGLATNVFYNAWYEVQVGLAASNAKSWKEKLNEISPANADPNEFGAFMQHLGLWNAYLQPQVGAITDPEQLAVSLTSGSATSQINVLTGQMSADNQYFQGWINDFAGSQAVIPNPSTCGTDCAPRVVQDSGSYLMLMYQDMFNALVSEIDADVPPTQVYNQVANTNIVPLYDQYNAMLVNFYQQAVVGLQQAYTTVWLTNEMNYFRAANGITGDQLIGWDDAPGTLYQYSGKSAVEEKDAYNTVQQRVAELYAARFNQLYLNTLNYVISDVPVSPQAYPSDPITYTVNGTPTSAPAVDYAGEVGAGVVPPTTTPAPGTTPAPTPVAPEQGRTPLSLVPPVLVNGTTWQSAAVLYQFSGLYDVAKCISSLEAYNQAAGSAGGTMQEWLQDPTHCPPILVLSDGSPLNQGFYDGNTLAPYTSFQVSSKTTGGPMSLTGTMTNNLKFCDPTTPALGWYAPSASFVGNAAGLVAGKGYLNCGRWYTPGVRSCGLPRANCPPSANDLYTVMPGPTNYISVEASNQGCTNNLKINSNKYPWILTLTDSYASDMKSCGAVIPAVSDPAGNKLSPVYTNARSESGSYWTGSSAGCSIGFIGQGINNHLPDYSSPDQAQFGMRLMNFTNSGNQGSGSGWVLPILAEVTCDFNSHPRTQILGWSEYQGTTAERGYICNNVSTLGSDLICTILDGTQYRLSVQVGSSAQLSVQVVQP